MPLNPDYLRSLNLPEDEATITDKDAMLYALSIGLNEGSLDPDELRYTYEKDLKVFPTMPVVIGHPGTWSEDPRTGIDYTKIVHGSQRIEVLAPLQIDRTIVCSNHIVGMEDKGDKGAVVTLVRELRDAETGTLLSRAESGIFCRGSGNFGGGENPCAPFKAVPDRAPDATVDMTGPANQALIYRLNMDRNPLHADPEVAKKAGFPRPILHGLATFGMTAVAVTRHAGGREPVSIEARFSSPVFPGETITIEVWDEGDEIAFRARIAARDVVVLDMGRATVA